MHHMAEGELVTKDYATFQVGGRLVKRGTCCALPGDRVEVVDETIVSLLERSPHHRNIVGILDVASKARYGFTSRGIPIYLFVPWNEAYPPFYVGCSHKDTSKQLLAVVHFEKWQEGSNCPRGALERIIGPCGSLPAEEEALLVHACSQPWKKSLLKPLVLPGPAHAGGTAFHVDPAGCKDIDDAITIDELGDQTASVHIHIADVAAVLALNPWLNHAAAIGQTIYKDGEIRCRMFPKEVEEACSLLPGLARPVLTLSFEWDMANKVPSKIRWSQKTIRVVESYTYETIYASAMASPLQQIASGIAGRELADSHDWIAELMIFYNAQAAKELKRASMGILRRHSPPEEGVILPEWLPKFMNYKAGEYCGPASDDVAHWGLQHPVYCHATSPIRRWADCINQLCLKQHILGQDVVIPEHSVAALNLIGKRVRAYERDIFFVNMVLSGEKVVDAHLVQKMDGQRARIWVPVWNRMITIRNVDVGELGEQIRGRVFVKMGQRNWKRRIVFECL